MRCTYDAATRGGNAPDGRKVKGTIHWLSAADAVPAEVRLYGNLFNSAEPPSGDDFLSDLNPDSLQVLPHAWLEPGLAAAPPGQTVQFERLGYFCRDRGGAPASPSGALIFNRTLGLRDSWAKIKAKTR